jgi:hypothetical protein
MNPKQTSERARLTMNRGLDLHRSVHWNIRFDGFDAGNGKIG